METQPNFTEEQFNAINYVSNNLHQKNYICIGGWAGTGKSTCLTELTQRFPNFAVCAFTGKAANVLRRKGINANTIHSTIYWSTPIEDELVFKLKNRSGLAGIGGFFVDEASMISKDLLEDLLSFGYPVVFFGDHGQLEPVGTGCNLMKQPDFALETIHRNANSIAKFAHFLRDGGSAINYPSDDRVKIVSKKMIKPDNIILFDQIICAFNKTRLGVNRYMRELYGCEGDPKKNEKIICLKNNQKYKIFNGMQGKIISIYKNLLTFKPDDDANISLTINTKQFDQEKVLDCAQQDKSRGYFDYGYCITCHKAQGDEWNNVLVFEEKSKMWDHKKWAYTAASRAKELLWWIV
jgi:exodeoxyribonuclease-5